MMIISSSSRTSAYTPTPTSARHAIRLLVFVFIVVVTGIGVGVGICDYGPLARECSEGGEMFPVVIPRYQISNENRGNVSSEFMNLPKTTESRGVEARRS